MVVVYRLSPMTYRLGRRFLLVENVAMVNLIAGRRIVPELIQDDCTAENVAAETLSLADRSRPCRAGSARACRGPREAGRARRERQSGGGSVGDHRCQGEGTLRVGESEVQAHSPISRHVRTWTSPVVSAGSANKEARRGKTRRRHSLCTAMALGPGVVLAEVVGSAFCPLSLSRRLRLFAPPALPAVDVHVRTLRRRGADSRGDAGLLKRTIASDANVLPGRKPHR